MGEPTEKIKQLGEWTQSTMESYLADLAATGGTTGGQGNITAPMSRKRPCGLCRQGTDRDLWFGINNVRFRRYNEREMS